MNPLSRFLSEVLAQGSDPVPQIPDPPPVPFLKPPEFKNGRPWVLTEDEHARWAAAGFPEVWEAK